MAYTPGNKDIEISIRIMMHWDMFKTPWAIG